MRVVTEVLVLHWLQEQRMPWDGGGGLSVGFGHVTGRGDAARRRTMENSGLQLQSGLEGFVAQPVLEPGAAAETCDW